jgi:hypothetical protein
MPAHLVALCLMWTLWKERNNCTFEDVEVSVVQMKRAFKRTLFKWSCVLGPSDIHSHVDFIDSLSVWL